MTDNKDIRNMAGELRNQAEKALQAERDRAYQYLDIAGVIMVCIAPDQAITLINRKGCEVLGYTQEELIGKNWFELVIAENERQRVKEGFATLMKGELEPIEHFENFVITSGGEKRLINWHNTLLRDKDGNITGTLSSGEDITERKQAEEKYRVVADNTYDWEWWRGPDEEFIYISPSCQRITGYSAKEMLADTDLLRRIIHPDDLPLYDNHVHWTGQGKATGSLEYRLIHLDGTIRWIDHVCQPVFDNDGQYLGTRGSNREITDRKRAEEALRNSEEKFRTLYEHAPVLIDAFEKSGRCTLWNKECQRVFGWTIDEINAHAEPLALFYPDPAIRREVIASVTSQPGKIFREWHPLTKDGKELTALWANFQLPDGMVINIGYDITDRKQWEEEQQKLVNLESIGLLAACIAHNFNNILTVILGSIEIAKMNAEPGSENHEVLEQAEIASLKAKDLTAELLTFAKGGEPVKKLTSLADLIKDAADCALAGSNVKCHFSINADLRQAEIDVVQVRHVVSNLAINARQAMPAGGTVELSAENMTAGSINGTAKESTLKAGDYIMISVTDHGSGIPEKNMGKIFDPFFTTKIGAVGLGLATSFSIVRRHGGHIKVVSKAGVGSTVYVYLPAAGKSS